MATLNGLSDVTWDSASSASIHFGATKVSLTKLAPAKVTIKTDKIGSVGSMLPNRRTPGKAEIGDFSFELLATDYQAHILPRMPKMGGTMVEFQITARLAHPTIAGSLEVLLDKVRIVEIDGPELDGSEKAVIYKCNANAMNRHDRGSDGKWKSLAWDTSRPSAEAQALMKF